MAGGGPPCLLLEAQPGIYKICSPVKGSYICSHHNLQALASQVAMNKLSSALAVTLVGTSAAHGLAEVKSKDSDFLWGSATASYQGNGVVK